LNRRSRPKRKELLLGLVVILLSVLIITTTIAIVNMASKLRAAFSLATDFGTVLELGMFESWESWNCLKEVKIGVC
jgi:hypothetical protein